MKLRRRNSVAGLALLMLLCNGRELARSSAKASHGTLVILVPTREGIIACADKRRWNQVTGATDDADKIERLGSKGAFAVSGNVEIGKPGMPGSLYSLSSSVKAFYPANAPSLRHHLSAGA